MSKEKKNKPILFINSLNPKSIDLAIITKKNIYWKNEKDTKIENLINCIDNLLKESQFDFKDLSGIIFLNDKSESFTNLRITALLVNLGGWLINCPILGLSLKEFLKIKNLKKELLILIQKKGIKNKLILPNYGKKLNLKSG